MVKSIYDLLNKKIDYRSEYEKIKKMFFKNSIVNGPFGQGYAYPEVFNYYINNWKYRGTKCSLKEVLDEIEKATNYGANPIDDCLYLCDLILNVKEFIEYAIKNFYNSTFYYKQLDDDMLTGNIYYLLNELGYCVQKEEEYKVLLIKKDADVINTALIIKDINISNLLMEYNDFKISGDIKEKQKILYALANYLEPKRKELREKNSKLEKSLFMAFNKLNIRHNNLEGKEKLGYTSSLTKEELLEWYDKIYNLVLISIRLLELDNQIKPFEDIAKKYFNN